MPPLNEVYGNSKSAILLLSDGNQTVGADYEFYGEQLQPSVYPVAIGDTTQYEDIAIGNVNSNRYAFLKNKYPNFLDLEQLTKLKFLLFVPSLLFVKHLA